MFLNITIPDNADCLLKPGQKVDFDTPFLEKKISTELSIEIALKLQIPSNKIFNYLKKFVGDTVEKGEILAKKSALLKNHVVVSEHSGIIKEINHVDGIIIISTSGSAVNQTKASFKGEICDIKKDKIKLKVEQLQEFPLKQVDYYFGGETLYLKDPDKPMFALQTSDKILITESVASYLRAKAEALGIRGFVTLKNPPQESNLPKAQIKNIDDLKKIFHLNFPYIYADKSLNKIYFYH